jgi:cbb3-type cytochrome oxidase cytochrome c subunit
MDEKRLEARMLCSELVAVEWRDKTGRVQNTVMNLEDISLSGACVQCERQVQRGTRLSIRYGNGALPGVVRYCVYAEGAYFMGVEFSDGCKWPTNAFRPKHLLDPRSLVGRAVRRDSQTIH